MSMLSAAAAAAATSRRSMMIRMMSTQSSRTNRVFTPSDLVRRMASQQQHQQRTSSSSSSFPSNSVLAARVAVGLSIIIPTAAILQAVTLIIDYRTYHRNASPIPELPQQGLVVGLNEDDETQKIKKRTTNHLNESYRSLLSKLRNRLGRRRDDDDADANSDKSNTDPFVAGTSGIVVVNATSCEGSNDENDPRRLPPLRLLVIGDSLAAGVGGSPITPVLPQTIAKALSQAYGGRSVHWTCVGSPGSSVSQIVRDIQELKIIDSTSKTMTTRHPLAPIWQRKQERWIELRQERRRGRDENVLFGEKTTNPIVSWWWTRVSDRIQHEWQDVRVAFLTPIENDDDNTTGQLMVPSENNNDHHPFDIAVVLTGLNDVKDQYLPSFLTTGMESSLKEGTQRLLGTFTDQLHHLMDVLRVKMVRFERNDDDNTTTTTAEKGTMDKDDDSPFEEKVGNDNRLLLSISPSKMPMIVLPALPIAPLQMFQLKPLCWFVSPVFQAMEDGKRRLADRFPNLVLFVEQPSAEFWNLSLLALPSTSNATTTTASTVDSMLIASDNIHPNDKQT